MTADPSLSLQALFDRADAAMSESREIIAENHAQRDQILRGICWMTEVGCDWRIRSSRLFPAEAIMLALSDMIDPGDHLAVDRASR